MIKLEINNSLCRIEGLSEEQYRGLRDVLSYTADGGYYSGSRPNKRYLLDRKGNFPTGLLYLVDAYFKGNKQYERQDRRIRPTSTYGLFKLKLEHTPYQEQVDAAEACSRLSRGIVAAPTGLGKSVIAALIINELQVPTLVVVPSLELKRQLTASLLHAFGNLDHITVENVDALDPTIPAVGYDCVIIDEFHHTGAATYRKLNNKAWGGIYYKFGLTATPFRSNDNERLLMESVLSQVIYRVEYADAVADKRIVPMEAYYIDLPVQEMRGNPNSWPAVYSELVVNNEVRNEIIASILGKFHVNKLATLCLVKEIRHGEILSEMTGAPFANGQDGNTRMRVLEFNLGESRSLIGTTGVIGEGVDTKPAEWIILAAGGKAKNQFMQACGRGFRVFPGKDSCKVILFRDASNPWLLKHFKACCKHMRDEYGIKPVKLEI